MSRTGRDRPAPWWLKGGSEHCEVCLGWYHYEVRVHCEDCDEPICPDCVVEVRIDRAYALCPACAKERG
jgi:hypothetical protein